MDPARRPWLALDLSKKEKEAFDFAYRSIAEEVSGIKLMVATYFDALLDNTALAVNLPVRALHVDLVRAPDNSTKCCAGSRTYLHLSVGVVDGRNVWKNDYERSLGLIDKAVQKLGRSG